MQRLRSKASGDLALRAAFVVALAWALLVLAASAGDALLADAFGADSGIRRHAGVILLVLALPTALLALTPVATVVWTWLWSRRRSGEAA